MDWQEALEIRVRQTKHERFRVLTAADHPDHLTWRRRMVEQVANAGTTPDVSSAPHPDVAESIALTRAMHACPFRSVDPGCGCNGGRCADRGGSIVSHIDCFACPKLRP
jgi:phage-related protein